MLYVIPIFPEAGFSWPFCNEQSVALSLNLIYVEQEGEALGNEKWGESSLIIFVDAISFVLIYFCFKYVKVISLRNHRK